jgi:hypothetical protein
MCVHVYVVYVCTEHCMYCTLYVHVHKMKTYRITYPNRMQKKTPYFAKKKQKYRLNLERPRTRTWNLLIRSQTRYPLRQPPNEPSQLVDS